MKITLDRKVSSEEGGIMINRGYSFICGLSVDKSQRIARIFGSGRTQCKEF